MILSATLIHPALVALLLVQQAGSSPAPIELEKAIELPGVEGRIDHLAVDLARERVFVAALGNDSVEVVDLKEGRHAQSLRGPGEPQGILYLSGADRMVVSCGKTGTCVVYDGATLKELATVPVGDDADNLRYDPSRKCLYVAFGEGALGVVDAETWKLVASIPLEGHPEAFCLDPQGERAFVNVPAAHQVAVVDLEGRKVLATWKVDEATANYPMTLVPGDATPAPTGSLLLGCRSPARLVLRALPDGKSMGALELSGDTDDLFFDAQRRRVYAACGEGFVDVFEQGQAGFSRVERVATAAGARTCLFVPERSQVLVAVPHRGAQRAEVRVFRIRG